jgi:hypothetical protein
MNSTSGKGKDELVALDFRSKGIQVVDLLALLGNEESSSRFFTTKSKSKRNIKAKSM